MEEAPENGKELAHSAHAKGIIIIIIIIIIIMEFSQSITELLLI
jgi:hypothetical protein